MSFNPALWIEAVCRRIPAAPALIGPESLTYGGLESRIHDLAAALTPIARPGAVVGLALKVRWQTVLHLLALMRCGAVPFPLDPEGPEGVRQTLLQSIAADALLQEAVLPRSGSPLPEGGSGPDTPDALRLVVATSGSGGTPRGVMLSGGNLLAAVRASAQRIPLGPGDRWLACLPMLHIGGLSILLRTLHAGAATVLQEGFDPERVWQALWDQGITHISLVPAMLSRLLDVARGRSPPLALRYLLVGGGPLDPSLARRAARWPLCVTYGMTETASQVATLCGPEAGRVAGRVGRVLPGFRVRIGEEGRIEVRGPAVMLGYANPQRRAGEGLRRGAFLTGDRGRIDADSGLIVLGRGDDLLVSGGETLDPVQIEALVARCPGVLEVGVSGRPDPVWGDRVVAFVVARVAAGEVERWCREHLPGHLRPRLFVSVRSLPRTPLGKLRRGELRHWARSGAPPG